MKRENVPEEIVESAVDKLRQEIERRLEEKGRGTFASPHEILGIISEEIAELTEAVRSNDMEKIRDELLDVAVAAVFGVACIHAGTVDKL